MAELSGKTMEELRAIAKERSIPGYSGLPKSELVALIEGHRRIPGTPMTDEVQPIPAPPPVTAVPDQDPGPQGYRADKRTWWCPKCDHSHPHEYGRCVRCGWSKP